MEAFFLSPIKVHFGPRRLFLVLEMREVKYQVGIGEHEYVAFYRASKKALKLYFTACHY